MIATSVALLPKKGKGEKKGKVLRSPPALQKKETTIPNKGKGKDAAIITAKLGEKGIKFFAGRLVRAFHL